MATTRKPRASAKAEAVPPVAVATEDLAAFIDWNGDKEMLSKAVAAASEAIALQYGKELPEKLPHELAQAVRLTATKLLLTGKVDEPVQAEELPAVARYFVRMASAQG